MQRVEDVVLQQLLVRDPDLDGLARRAVLAVPALDQRNVERASSASGPEN